MTPSPFLDDDQRSIDPSIPFQGVVVCCTSIPPEQRTDLGLKIKELGGIHKYDLTPDVTHLIVGDYDTPKYRHVARERLDIKPMEVAWIEEVANLWRNDEDIDFNQLEKKHQMKPLARCGIGVFDEDAKASVSRESLLVCLTGFAEERDDIAAKLAANGAVYAGDLTRRCTHLIAKKPEGKKFTAAKSWNIRTVTIDWLLQSIERGMILEETKFDPLLPPEEQGVDAWIKRDPRRTSLGKRSRSSTSTGTETDGKRKLRKTASVKLNSQRSNIWGDILGGRSGSREYSFAKEENEQPLPEAPLQRLEAPREDRGFFYMCVFYIHGFNQQRREVLEQIITTHDGITAANLAAVPEYPTDQGYRRFLIVPQASQPDTHPFLPEDDIQVVTEFYIERCMHNKRFVPPHEHVLGRPFPLFPIAEFATLTICSAAFSGIELNQVARSVTQLGAKYDEEFRRSTSLVVCRDLRTMRREKLRLALSWGVPVVSADWLWECISTGFNVPIEDYIFPEVKRRQSSPEPTIVLEKQKPSKPTQRTKSEPIGQHKRILQRRTTPPETRGVDNSGFDRETPEKLRKATRSRWEDLTTSADVATARSQLDGDAHAGPDAPLSELSSASLNKSPSPTKSPRSGSLPRTKSDPIDKSTATQVAQPGTGGYGNAPLRPPAQAERAAERLAAEEARRQARIAEQRALSSKLDSLVGDLPGSAADVDTQQSHHTQGSHGPRLRRRQILGRAISNVSAGSSGAATPVDVNRSAPNSFHLGDDDNDDDDDEQQAAPATQLEYVDPNAQEVRAAMMSRMMNKDGTSSSAGNGRFGHATAVVGGGRELRKR